MLDLRQRFYSYPPNGKSESTSIIHAEHQKLANLSCSSQPPQYLPLLALDGL